MKPLLLTVAMLATSVCWGAAPVVGAPTTPAAKGPNARTWAANLGVGMVVDWALTDRGIREFDPLAVKDFQQRGLHHVRIRIAGPITSQKLVHLRKIVEACEQYNLVPVIAYQAEEFKADPTARNQAKLVDWWLQVANYFADKSPTLGFDIISDPGDKLSRNPQLLNKVYEKVVAAIRSVSPIRMIMIAPDNRGAPESLASLKWPAQSNNRVMAEWHIFPYGPIKNNGKYPWTIGTAAEKAAIRGRIYAANHWQQKTGHLVWLGAWSAGQIVKNASLKNPIAFVTFVACELQKNHLPYAINPSTQFYDGEEGAWRPSMAPLLDAMIKPDCASLKTNKPAGKAGHETAVKSSAGAADPGNDAPAAANKTPLTAP